MIFHRDAIYTFETYNIQIPEHALIKLEDGIRKKKAQLLTIDASHYAFWNGNGTIYRHDTVAEDIPSFMMPRPKPIIEAHRPETSEVFGKVIAADYKLTDYYNHFSKDWELEGLTTEEYIDLCKDVLIPYQRANRAYNGLAFVQVVGKLSHEEAIKKVLDKQFVTVSIGAIPNRMICSECLQDQTQRLCSHYANKRNNIFMLAESLEYEELSFVKKPADPFGRIVRIHDGQMEEFKFERESNILGAEVGVIDTETFFNNINSGKKIVCVENVCTIINDDQEDDVMAKINVSLIQEFGEQKLGALSIKITDSEEVVGMEAYQVSDEDFEGMKNTHFAIVQKTNDGEKRRFPLNNEANVLAGLALIADAEDLTDAEREKAKGKLEKTAKKLGVVLVADAEGTQEKEGKEGEGENPTLEDNAPAGDSEREEDDSKVKDIDTIITELRASISKFKEEVAATLKDGESVEADKDPVSKLFDLLKWFALDVSFAGASLNSQIGYYLEEQGKKAIANGQYDELVSNRDELVGKVSESETKIAELNDSITELQEEVEALDSQNIELNYQLRANSIEELVSNKVACEVINDSEEAISEEKEKLFKLPFEALKAQVTEYRKLVTKIKDNSVNNNKKQIEKVVDPTLNDSAPEGDEGDQEEEVTLPKKLTDREVRDALQSVKPNALSKLLFKK